MIEAATEFRKNSFNDSDSATLAKVATTFQNVADEAMSASDSASFIIAQMKAFNIEASDAEHIIDAVNAVSNNYAVSSGQLAQNLGNMSAAMATGNNTFEQSLGMLTAMTEITRNAAKGSRALITVQGRLNQVVDESSDTGKALTEWYGKHKIAIKNDEGQVRSLYEVLTDVAKIWPTLTKNEQMYYLQQQAGTTQTQNLAALLQNYETAIKATNTALESNGSAMQENERYMESITAKEQALKAEFEDFANRVLSSELVGGFLDAGKSMLDFANNDVGAATVRIAAFSATTASVVGIVGNVIGKMQRMSSVLSAMGAGGSGVLGLLTSPKTLLIIGGIVAAIGLIVEGTKAINQAIENSKFENLEKQAEELRNQVDQTKDALSEARQKLVELNEVPLKDRASEWYKETEQLKQQIEAYEYLLELREKDVKDADEKAYSADVSGKTQARALTDDDGYNRFLSGELMSEDQIKVATAQYDSLTEAIQTNAKVFMEYFDEKSRVAISEAIAAGDFDKAIQLERRALQMLGITFQETTQTAEEYEQSQAEMMTLFAQEISGVRSLNAAQKEQYESYLTLNQGRYEYLSAKNELTESEQAFVDAYNNMLLAFMKGNRDIKSQADVVNYLSNALGITSEEAYKLGTKLGIVDLAWRDLRDDLYGVDDVSDEMSTAKSKVDSYIDALNEYRQANQATVNSNSVLVQSLFDSNGQLTETGKQALQTSSSMANMAKTFIEAQQAQAQADFSALLLAIQEVGSQASITASQIASMMSMAGVSISGVDTDEGYAKFKGQLSAQLNREATDQDVLDYIRKQGEANYQKKMEEYKDQLSQIGNYVSSGAGSTAKKVEETAKDSIDNVSDYAEKAAQAAQQKIEDAFNKLREAEEKYWDDKIDALEKQNEQIDRQVQLEEKLKALQEAKQKKILLYKDGRFQYSEDIAAIEGAQYDYDQTYRDIANEEQKEILNDLKEKALALIDEYREKALEQGTLTQDDIKSLLDEYHNLGNQTYNTVAYGVENMTNLISAGMQGMIAAASGNITDVSGLLNSAFGSGLSSILGGAGSGLGGTGYLDKWSSSWAEGTAESVLYGGAKDYLASPAEPGYLQRSKNYTAAVSDYYTNAKNYGADVAWWIQAMSDDSFRKNYFSQSKDDLLNTDWAKFAETAKDWNEFQESMARGIAKIKYLNLDVDIDKWISDLFTVTRANKDSFMYQEGYSADELAASALRESGVSNRSQLGFIQAKYLADTLNPENEEDLYKFINYRLNSGARYGNMAQMREVTKEMINRDDRTRENMLSMYKDMLIDFQNAVDHFSDSAEMTDEEFEAFRLAISGTPIWDNFYYQGSYDLQKQALTGSRDAVIKKMAENSLAWKSADPTERARLAAENQKLGAAIGATYTDGKWDFGEDVSEIVSQAKANADSLEKANKENNDSLENTIKESITDVIDQIKKNTDRMLATDDENEKMILEAENENLANSIGVDYEDGALDEESVRDAIKDKMRENARAWHNASDEEKARLHAENEQLGASIGAKYDNGIWHYASGTRSAHGGLSLVGEDGPEMRVLGKGDGVIPSDITNTLWKFGQNPKLFMRSLGESVSNVFNIDNLQLPNVKDPASFISGLKEFAYQYVTAR